MQNTGQPNNHNDKLVFLMQTAHQSYTTIWLRMK